MVNEQSLGVQLLIKQKKQHESIHFGFWDIMMSIFKDFMD